MKMESLIQKISEMYRKEINKESDLQRELWSVECSLAEAEKTDGENITLAEYNNLLSRKERLTKEIELIQQYQEGISDVREMLMDLGFDTKIK